MITMKVGVAPGRIDNFSFEEGTTVGGVLELAGLSPDGYQVKMDGKTITNLDTVAAGDMILLVKQVKGNK